MTMPGYGSLSPEEGGQVVGALLLAALALAARGEHGLALVARTSADLGRSLGFEPKRGAGPAEAYLALARDFLACAAERAVRPFGRESFDACVREIEADLRERARGRPAVLAHSIGEICPN